MRTHDLHEARADGWLEQLGRGSQGFAQLCEAVGEKFVAFAVIAGVRITALTIDPRNPSGSLVDFEVGDAGGPQRMRLGEFRDRLAEALLGDDEVAPALSASPTSEELQAHIGFRYVLLAPVFQIRLDTLFVSGPESRVRFTQEGKSHETSLAELRRVLRDKVRAEAERHRAPAPFAIDLALVPQAREALARGDAEKVSELLGAWPGPLSLLLRTAEGQRLAPEVRATLAESLGLLGTAYVEFGRHDWAQEVLRLGIQWAQDRAEAAADLFFRLGLAHLAQQRHGEAIGLLRRAAALGAPRRVVLPALAKAFLSRGRHLAAILLAEDALVAGASPDDVREVRDRARSMLGPAWDRFRARVPQSSGLR